MSEVKAGFTQFTFFFVTNITEMCLFYKKIITGSDSSCFKCAVLGTP